LFFPFAPFPACFFLHLSGSGKKQAGNGAKGRTEAGGGWQGASGGAVRDKHALSFGATPAHQPELPPEPRPSGAHPEEAEWEMGRSHRILCVHGTYAQSTCIRWTLISKPTW